MKSDYSLTLFASSLIWLAGCFSPSYAWAENVPEAAIAAPAPEGRTMQGTVLDEFNEPLIGATVKIKGSNNGTLCDTDGQANNVNNLKPFTFTVPTDAACGSSRIRFVFSDAWFPHPAPVGLTTKGFTIDIGLEISGNNPQRQPPVPVYDEGVADEPEGLNGGDDAVRSVAPQPSDISLKDGILQFYNVEKAWIYTTDGRLVRHLQHPTQLPVNFASGTYIIKLQDHNVLRTRKVTIK